MGLFSKLIGMPEPDPSGGSRAYFEMVAKTAMKMVMRRDIPSAVKHMDIMLMNISQKFGYQHPDVGRAKLAKAAFLYIGGDLKTAGAESIAALDVLEQHPDFCGIDIVAAKDFQELIASAVNSLAGMEDDDVRELEDRPFGQWVHSLEM